MRKEVPFESLEDKLVKISIFKETIRIWDGMTCTNVNNEFVRIENIVSDLIAPTLICRLKPPHLTFVVGLFHLQLQETSPQQTDGLSFVVVLRSFILTADRDPRGHVDDTHGAFGGIDVLTSRTTRSKGLDLEILWIDFWQSDLFLSFASL